MPSTFIRCNNVPGLSHSPRFCYYRKRGLDGSKTLIYQGFPALVPWLQSEIICSPFSFLHSPTKENLTRVLFYFVGPALLHHFLVHHLPVSLQELQEPLLGQFLMCCRRPSKQIVRIDIEVSCNNHQSVVCRLICSSLIPADRRVIHMDDFTQFPLCDSSVFS